MEPEVSIVMPFRNAASTIGEAVASVLEQTMQSWELLAVDDGSTDGGAQALPNDRRIHLIQPGAVGLVSALNLGIERSRAPRIARMDADDLMAPDRLGAQVELLKSHPGLALVASSVHMFPEAEVQGGFREYLRWQDRCVSQEEIAANIYVEAPFVHPTVMFRRSPEIRYRHGDFPEDYELWLRMHEWGLGMRKIPRPLLRWRHGAGRATMTDPRYSRSAFDRIRGAYLARDPRLRSGRDVVVWGSGRKTRLRLRRLLESGVRPCAWIDIDPAKIARKIDGAPVYPPDWLDREPRPFVLSCVTTRGAHDLVAVRLAQMGYLIGRDYLPVGL